ncbi:MAG: DNA replication/repair protein RecF [Bacilli bacterium]|nr:DNA replication/repair protein RecF [Bacilli bacterium]
MKIRDIKLLNFRNYSNLELEFSDNINIIIGNNGEGKTNILESIYVLSLTKSNRYGIDNDLIKFGEEGFTIKGSVYNEELLRIFMVNNTKTKKRVFINNKEINKISDYISNFCVISFSPNDLEIIKNAPAIRRNYINIEISQLYNNYITYLNEYNAILKMRNDYLKKMNLNAFIDKRYLDVLNDKLIENAFKIYKYRFDYIKNINNIIGDIFSKIANLKELKIVYDNSFDLDDYDEELIKERMKDKFDHHYNQELMLGNTLYGPHRDDIKFMLNDMDMKLYASQGQQRLALISFKIAELYLFKKVLGSFPVLLLDDIFSEIDIKKRNKIIKYIDKDIQTIITTTDINDIEDKLLENAKLFKIKNGKITTKGGIKNGRRRKSTR